MQPSQEGEIVALPADSTQDGPILRTKLFIPPIRPELVSRPRLVEQLCAGLDRKLTLVSAPAGFGKSTLLSECAARCGRSVTWVSLDKGDNTPSRFWSYVVAALQTLQPSVGKATLALLRSSGIADTTSPPSIESLLAGLINDAAGIREPFILVLDDIHLITEPQIHEGLTFLLDHMPRQMHLVLSGRSDPPWPLARLRARGEMTELRAPDLRFTLHETAAFLSETMDLDLSPSDMVALEARTEGWIAGLQMAAISMRGQKRMHGERGLSRFVEAFTGSHRFILDYLMEEVLSQQATATQEFLLKTSILERLTASLCDAVRFGIAEAHGFSTGGDSKSNGEGSIGLADNRLAASSQGILLDLEQNNLFLIPLDHERHWYRYHHLFADLLRSRLEQTWPERVPELHIRASEWYEEKDLIAEAVSHALAANDFERAACLVERHALDVIYHVELTSVVRWLDALPPDVVRSRPWLCVAHAWALLYAGQMEAVESRLQDAESALPGWDGVERTEVERVAGHIATIRGYAAGVVGDPSRAAELSRQALKSLPRWDSRARSFAAGTLGSALRWLEDLAAAAKVTSEAIDISRAAGENHLAMVVLSQLAGIQALQGHLHQAAATCQDALQLSEEHLRQTGRRLPVTGYTLAQLSEVLYQWNDLEAALHHARQGLEICKEWGQKTVQPYGYMVLADALQASGDAGRALDAIQSAREIASQMSPWLGLLVDAAEAKLWLAQGNLDAASRWAEGSGLWPDSESDLHELGEIDSREQRRFFVLARALIAVGRREPGRLDQALGLLARLLEIMENLGAVGKVIEILILQALALEARGERERALAALERALSLSEPESHVRVFLDEGAPMAALLREAAVCGLLPEATGRLLAEFGVGESKAVADSQSPRRLSTEPKLRAPALVEGLTERELDVLRLLATELSTVEIADRLYISVHTIRSHTKSIYGKLEAHSRIEAVARARELGLL